MTSVFHFLETSSQAERLEIAASLLDLYSRFKEQENEAFSDLLHTENPRTHAQAQIRYSGAISRLGAIQAVFDILRVEIGEEMA